MPPIIPISNQILGDDEDAEPYINNLINSSFGYVETFFLSDSESDNESSNHDGYEPLSQDPLNSFYSGSEVLWVSDSSNSSDTEEENPTAAAASNDNSTPPLSTCNSDEPQKRIIQNEAVKEETIPMTQERIDEIKAAMKDITIPTAYIPAWAHVVPEDQWKNVVTTITTAVPKNNSTIKKGGKKYPGPPVVCDNVPTQEPNADQTPKQNQMDDISQ